MSTFVLVHGAWHGGWCWDRVAGRLRHDGHEVLTPTLAGAEAGAPTASAVGLRDHVDQVVALLRDGDLRDVVLVGHSYAGLVVREVADREPDRVAELVLVDAWVGRDGDSLDSLAPEWFRTWIETNTSEGLIAIPAPGVVGITEADDIAWVEPLLTAQPRRTFSEPTRLTGAVDTVPCRAVVCSPGNGIPFRTWAEEVAGSVIDVETGHDVMVTEPEQLTRFLTRAA
ncbi:alpha/beta fold hydrolase [Nocardioides halotolerans]|jgi:pimeloyl-ACP methyl ester carboxylesterase|uniref:alpha/beta fold hydrolase n=1 Tax=Nocardioides halotolerans TaxID=433660 RepID=UPI000403FF56|nr:alpha/beta hydrolase family protein [Nocardioides halotolerans]